MSYSPACSIFQDILEQWFVSNLLYLFNKHCYLQLILAAIRVTADGGTNRWFSYIKENNISFDDVTCMDFVSGDFDSIKEKNKEAAKNLGAEVNNLILLNQSV